MSSNGNNRHVTDEYIEFVFEKVIELYKDTVPDILGVAFNIDAKDVHNLTAKDVKEKLDLTLKYEVNQDDGKEASIKYIDNVMENLLKNMANGNERYVPVNNQLLMQTSDRTVLEATSSEEIKMSTENYRNSGIEISRIISDIDYVTHEMGHAFEHLINASNPSYLYEFYTRNFRYSNQDLDVQYDFIDGEQFPISMERIVLEHLKEVGLERYGLEKYANIHDVDLVYNTKRHNESIICKRKDGTPVTGEINDTILYQLYKTSGSKGLADFIAKRDFVKFREQIPTDKANVEAVEQYYRLFENPSKMQKIYCSGEYPQLFSKEILNEYLPYLYPEKDIEMSDEYRMVRAEKMSKLKTHIYEKFSKQIRGEKSTEDSVDEVQNLNRKKERDSKTIETAKQAFAGLNNSLADFKNEEEAIKRI